MQERQLHVRQPAGFDDATFDVFCASADIFMAHANALLQVWHRLPGKAGDPVVTYSFERPVLNADRTIASLTIAGEQTLGTRASIEIGSAHLLWMHFPIQALEGMDQGRTEHGKTEWWPLHQPSGVASLDPEWRKRYLAAMR